TPERARPKGRRHRARTLHRQLGASEQAVLERRPLTPPLLRAGDRVKCFEARDGSRRPSMKFHSSLCLLVLFLPRCAKDNAAPWPVVSAAAPTPAPIAPVAASAAPPPAPRRPKESIADVAKACADEPMPSKGTVHYVCDCWRGADRDCKPG